MGAPSFLGRTVKVAGKALANTGAVSNQRRLVAAGAPADLGGGPEAAQLAGDLQLATDFSFHACMRAAKEARGRRARQQRRGARSGRPAVGHRLAGRAAENELAAGGAGSQLQWAGRQADRHCRASCVQRAPTTRRELHAHLLQCRHPPPSTHRKSGGRHSSHPSRTVGRTGGPDGGGEVEGQGPNQKQVRRRSA